MNPIYLGLIAMFFWGIAKVISKPAINRIGPYYAVCYEHLSVALVLLIAFLVSGAKLLMPTGTTIYYLIAAVVIGALAIYFFFKAMHLGKVSLTAPVNAPFIWPHS